MREIIILLLAALAAPSAVISATEPPDQNKSRKPVRVINEQGYRVQLDLSTQVLWLAVPQEKGLGSGMSAAQEESPIAPTLAGIAGEQFISASVLAQKAKQFDDGLYAAVELTAQQGAGKFSGKASLLAHVVESFIQGAGNPSPEAMLTVFAAAKLGSQQMALPTVVREPVREDPAQAGLSGMR